MCESANEDNVSNHSNESNNSLSMKNDTENKLSSLINMELKHSSVYNDLHAKNNLLKVDLENLHNSCKRFENQIKIKSELLEEYHEKLVECQKQNKLQLKEKLSSVLNKLDETNSLFYGAFDYYSSKSLRSAIDTINSEIKEQEEYALELKKQLQAIQENSKITKSLMKPKNRQISNIDFAINILFEFSMKRPEIEIEETASKLTDKIKKLEQKKEELNLARSKYNR